MPESALDRSTIDAVRDDFRARLAAVRTEQDLKAVQDEFLGRKSGRITNLLKGMGAVAAEARREFGALVNTLKSDAETAVDERRTAMAASRPPAGAIDVTLPGRPMPLGRIHPLMRVRQQVE